MIGGKGQKIAHEDGRVSLYAGGSEFVGVIAVDLSAAGRFRTCRWECFGNVREFSKISTGFSLENDSVS